MYYKDEMIERIKSCVFSKASNHFGITYSVEKHFDTFFYESEGYRKLLNVSQSEIDILSVERYFAEEEIYETLILDEVIRKLNLEKEKEDSKFFESFSKWKN
ncbi:hypothetical protein ACYSNR_09230 [Enterococcus sp. LJL128]